MSVVYPSTAPERTRWIRARRGPRNQVTSTRPYAFFSEPERNAAGAVTEVSTVFLTNRECPWHCVMCDLWKNTTDESLSGDDIVGQLRFALQHLPPAPVLKLYNSGSFFDSAAIPRSAWPQIAELCRPFDHVIVESHPRLIGPAVLELCEMLDAPLEVALGLETAHPTALEALNKGIDRECFQRAAAFLSDHGVALRTFLLVHPPFVSQYEKRLWLERSVRFATDAGAGVVSLIPLRGGNGALEALIEQGAARLPNLAELEEALEVGLRIGQGRCFADTWDLKLFSKCDLCLKERTARLGRINLSQQLESRICCKACGAD